MKNLEITNQKLHPDDENIIEIHYTLREKTILDEGEYDLIVDTIEPFKKLNVGLDKWNNTTEIGWKITFKVRGNPYAVVRDSLILLTPVSERQGFVKRTVVFLRACGKPLHDTKYPHRLSLHPEDLYGKTVRAVVAKQEGRNFVKRYILEGN